MLNLRLVGQSSARNQLFADVGLASRSGSAGRPAARVFRNDCTRCNDTGARAALYRSLAASNTSSADMTEA